MYIKLQERLIKIQLVLINKSYLKFRHVAVLSKLQTYQLLEILNILLPSLLASFVPLDMFKSHEEQLYSGPQLSDTGLCSLQLLDSI